MILFFGGHASQSMVVQGDALLTNRIHPYILISLYSQTWATLETRSYTLAAKNNKICNYGMGKRFNFHFRIWYVYKLIP